MATRNRIGMDLAGGLLSLALLAACDQGAATNEATPAKGRQVSSELTGNAGNCPPPRGWNTVEKGYEEGLGRVRNIVVLTGSNELLWNEAPIDLEQLRKYLVLTSQMEPEPILELRPHPRASCDLMSRVVAATVAADLDCAALCRFELARADDRRSGP